MASLSGGLFWYITAVEILALVVALILVVLAYRGYKKSENRSLFGCGRRFRNAWHCLTFRRFPLRCARILSARISGFQINPSRSRPRHPSVFDS